MNGGSTMSGSREKCVIVNPLIVLREEFDDGALLFDPETGATYGINPIGVLVWKHLDGCRTVDELAGIVCASFDAVPAAAADHIRDFLKTAVALGLAGFTGA